MDIDQLQRKDIDLLESNTVSLSIDEMVNTDEGFIDLLSTDIYCNNWFSDDGAISKNSIRENERLVFSCPAESDWVMKDIVGVKLAGEIVCDDNIMLESVGLNNKFTNCEIPINDSTNINVSLNIEDFSQEELNSLVISKGFDIVINFDSLKSNASVSIVSLQAIFSFSDKLQQEKDAINNRLSNTSNTFEDDNIFITNYSIKLGERQINNLRFKIKNDITATSSWNQLDYSDFIQEHDLTPFHEVIFTDGKIIFRLQSTNILQYKSLSGTSVSQSGGFWLEFNYMN